MVIENSENLPSGQNAKQPGYLNSDKQQQQKFAFASVKNILTICE
jgi:hypothetical protein